MVSSPNVAANDYWAPGVISAPEGTTFILKSAYLTACSFPVVLTVSGSKQGAPVFESTFHLTTDGPTYANFGSKVVDSVIFTVNPEVNPDPYQPQGQIVMDNLNVTTINAGAVPWKGKSTGRLTPLPPDGQRFDVAEWGTATHVGNFTETGTFNPANGITWIVITAANGDKLFGYVADEWGTLPVIQVSIVIYDGTDRFKGATGSYVGTLTVDMKTLTFTATSTGTISTVGANKK
jgi:hypothetical protein